jgi:hypothetical protein
MKQYRITSETFHTPGDDPAIPDNYVDPAELARIKKLAGIDTLGIMEKSGASLIDGHVGTDNGAYQRKHDIQPGTDEWFKLWFSRPTLTGENPTSKDK